MTSYVPVTEDIPEQELRQAVMIRHPLTNRELTTRFQFTVSFQVSKGRFSELWGAFVELYKDRPGLIAGAWYDEPGPARTLAWCGEDGERIMLIADGSGKRDNSIIHLAFSNFEVPPELPCWNWRPVKMKSRDGANPWGVEWDDLITVERFTPPVVKPKSMWTRIKEWFNN